MTRLLKAIVAAAGLLALSSGAAEAQPGQRHKHVLRDGHTCESVQVATERWETTCDDGGSFGHETHSDGTRSQLRLERDARKLWLGRSWKEKRRDRPEALPRELDPAPAPDQPGAAIATPGAAQPATGADTGATVQDVLVVWGTKARAAQGGDANMRALAAHGVALNNSAYANSRVVDAAGAVLVSRLAGAEFTSYTEGDISQDLSRLYLKADGYMDDVHTRRAQLGADFVSLFGEGYAAAGGCGIGYLRASAASAMTVVDRTCVSGRYSFAHELGHNQGAHHDPVTVCGQPTCSGYNYGHVFGSLGTIMSYNGSRVLYFSNPSVIHPSNGLATGVANAKDNARVLRESMAYVAGFFSAPVLTGFPPSGVVKQQAVPNNFTTPR